MSEIKPALTAEEWARQPSVADLHPVEARHAIAAVALYQQEFGFTWDDVDAIRELAEEYPRVALYPLPDQSWHSVDLHGLADRISALLPPRDVP